MIILCFNAAVESSTVIFFFFLFLKHRQKQLTNNIINKKSDAGQFDKELADFILNTA